MLFGWKVGKHVKSIQSCTAAASRRSASAPARWRGSTARASRCGRRARRNSTCAAPWWRARRCFPFADGLIAAADAGATAAIQPGGAIRDAEIIAAADARGMTMVFTGIRHFRH